MTEFFRNRFAIENIRYVNGLKLTFFYFFFILLMICKAVLFVFNLLENTYLIHSAKSPCSIQIFAH